MGYVYGLLIVDDEIHAAHGIKEGINWSQIGFTNVYVAYNIRQAKEIIAKLQVDLMICDIEMPQGNGLELLTWVKRQYLEIKCIFLTCHAEFQYAQQALQLGSLDYLLKPVRFGDLEHVVKNIVKKMEADKKGRFTDTLNHYYQLWSEHHPLLVERFWLDLINQTISTQPKQLTDIMEKRNIPYSLNEAFRPVLISLRKWSVELSDRDRRILEYAFRNAAEHSLQLSSLEYGCVVSMTEQYLIVLLSAKHPFFFAEHLLEKQLQDYIGSCSYFFYCEVCVYLGIPTFIDTIRDAVCSLMQQDIDNVTFSNKVFRIDHTEETPIFLSPPNLDRWIELLKQGEKLPLLKDITAYLELMEKSSCDAKMIQQFYHDFLQMVYHVFHLKGLQAHLIFAEAASYQKSSNVTRSISNLREWVNQVIDTGIYFIQSTEQSHTIIDRIKEYIRDNIEKDLSRDDIADYAFLNPDYLSRLFKKEAGISLSDYLIEAKCNYAQQLLLKTDKPVSEIAASLGYTNFSHFSKMFKRVTDMSPLEFRKYHQRI